MNEKLKEWIKIIIIVIIIDLILFGITHFYLLEHNYLYACSYYNMNCTGV